MMKRFALSPNLFRRPFVLPALLVVITVAQMLFVSLVQRLKGFEYFDLNSLKNFHIDAPDIGFFTKEIIVPVAFLFILTGLPFFRRWISKQALKRDAWLLFGFLCVAQLLFLAYSYASRPDYQLQGVYFLILAAGFLGGWRMGLGLAVLSYPFIVWRAFLTPFPDDFEFAFVHMFFYDDMLPIFWQAAVIGIVAGLLKERRFVPVIALALGFLVEASGRYLAAPASYNSWIWSQHIITISLISGMALAFVALLVRNLQVSVIAQQARESQLAITQAELKALRAQINPHFIFNSLNTIRYFVRTEPDKARDLLLDLSEIFQRSLKSGDFVSLREEKAYVDAYLALEKARLDERLRINWVVPDERVLDIKVPTLILQPIVENAVIHGIGQKTEGGTLTITVETWDSELVMQVRDDGAGFDSRNWRDVSYKPADRDRASIGLSNIDNRLQLLYGETYGLKLESELGIGTRVQLRIPTEPNIKVTQVNPDFNPLPSDIQPVKSVQDAIATTKALES